MPSLRAAGDGGETGSSGDAIERLRCETSCEKATTGKKMDGTW